MGGKKNNGVVASVRELAFNKPRPLDGVKMMLYNANEYDVENFMQKRDHCHESLGGERTREDQAGKDTYLVTVRKR